MKYQHLFFDLDHTLWDFESNSKAVLEKIYSDFELQEKGIPHFEIFYEIYKGHNNRLWQRYRNGYIKREELKWKRMWLTLLDFKIANENLSREMAAVFMQLLPLQNKLFPYTFDILDYCQSKGYGLHLITNGFRDTQEKKLKSSGLESYFTHVITSEESQTMKPYPEIFYYSLNIAKASAAQSLMIGDNLEVDILGAKNIGMEQVYFNPNKIKHQEQPTFEISNLKELELIL
ncbi:MAG TPA: YjjG family noncanonical pyrimidine nucleotidase [Edaphocola sp.]|nr:YjjG family noncanonical pyrimidine nucleotidase [Edaphocola sp.]